MGEEVHKVTTIMVLEVDLQCFRCYKKVKKVLCKIPQIQDQVYDEKKNLVMIKVVCCSPEKIKQKIICKGGDSIKSIEIKQPPKPAEKPKEKAEKPKDPPKPAEKPKEPEKPKDPPKPAEKPKEPEKPKDPPKPAEKPKEPEKPKEKPADPPKPAEKPKEPAPAPKPPVAVPFYPVLPPGYPNGTCCSSCYEGRGGGPCFHGHGGPPPGYEGYGRPVYDSYGGGYYRPACNGSRCDYFNEENTSGCTIM